jgi:hypothetical protein
MAIEPPDLIFRRSGRRAETLAALIACVLFLIIALAWKAPAIFYGPIALAIAVLGVVLKRNPVHGMRLTPSEWQLWSDGTETVVPLAALAAVRVTRWSDGAPSVTLRHRDGTEEDVPSLCPPPVAVLAAALDARGVRVDWA